MGVEPEKTEWLNWTELIAHLASQVAPVVKNPPASAGDMRHKLRPWVKKIPWRRKRQPTPVFLPGEPHGQRSLPSCTPWGHKRVGYDWVCTHARSYYTLTLVRPWDIAPVLCTPCIQNRRTKDSELSERPQGKSSFGAHSFLRVPGSCRHVDTSI